MCGGLVKGANGKKKGKEVGVSWEKEARVGRKGEVSASVKEARDLNFYEKLMEKVRRGGYTGRCGERKRKKPTRRDDEARETSCEPLRVDGRATGRGI
jgi:hypothetical protein